MNTLYPAGRTTEVDDGAGARTFSYDDLNEMLTATTTYLVVPGNGGNVNPAKLPAQTITYTHNPDGSEASMQTPGGLFSYAYYNNGWLSQITNPSGLATQSGYFANGWLAYEQTFKGGTLVTSATSTYNPRGFLTLLANTGMGSSYFGGTGNPNDLPKMTYDGAGDLTSMQSYITAAGAQAGGSSYAYDYKSQLTGETTNRGHVANNSFVYDAAGNATTLRGMAMPTVNGDNQYTGAQFVYDGNGNPTTYSGHAATYDEESRLTTLLGDTHGYTADGMRSSKQIGTNARTYFLYDGDDVVCELDASGNVIATNTWGGSGLVARTTSVRTVCYAFDPQGNVSQAIDPNAPAGSQILNSCSADAYGYRYASGTYTDPYMGFGGKWGYYTDAEVGTQLLGHRFYDSGAGRFINRDPVGYSGGVNQYGYTSNSPVNRADPSGFQWYGQEPMYGGDPYNRGFFTLIGHLWSTPNNIAGAICSIGGSWTYDRKHQIVKVKGGWMADSNRYFGFGGITIGDFVMSDYDLVGKDLEHECTHATQGRLLGIFYLPSILDGYGAGYLLDPDNGHDASMYEIWADYGGGRLDQNTSSAGKGLYKLIH